MRYSTHPAANDTQFLCPSCGRDVRDMHPDYRARKANGKMAHLEMDPETGATILLEEPQA